MIPRVLRKVDFAGKARLDDEGRPIFDTKGDVYKTYAEPVVASVDEANVITSAVEDEIDGEILHAPVLDFDFPCELWPSTTLNHHHLVINKTMTWSQYRLLLTAMEMAGLLEEGYVSASLQRGYTAIRTPGEKKVVSSEPTCYACGVTATVEYADIAAEEMVSPVTYAKQYEGTYNSRTNHFACNACYIKAGMPTAPSWGWKAP